MANIVLLTATAAMHHHNNPFQTTKNKRKLDDYEAEVKSLIILALYTHLKQPVFNLTMKFFDF